MRNLSVYYLPEHLESPIDPRSGQELVEAVDDFISSGDRFCTLMSAVVVEADGSHSVWLGVGYDPGSGLGSILLQSGEGEFYTKSECCRDATVSYFDFGNERVFPGNSQIGIRELKQALIQFFENQYHRPVDIEWQVWSVSGGYGDIGSLESIDDPWG